MAMATALRRLAKAQGQHLQRALQQAQPAACASSFRLASNVSPCIFLDPLDFARLLHVL
jgi:hypothetical protein